MVGVFLESHHPLGLHRPNHIGVDFVSLPKMLGIAVLRLPSVALIASCDHAYRLHPQGLH